MATKKPPTLKQWDRLNKIPIGDRIFSFFMCVRVPYFATVLPRVTQLRPGFCEVTAPKWIGVHNHLKTFHAIAACNLAEIAMGMLAEATVPTTHRWIPAGMEVKYLAKAKTRLRAVAELPEIPTFTEPINLEVPIKVYDLDETVVVEAVITIKVSTKK